MAIVAGAALYIAIMRGAVVTRSTLGLIECLSVVPLMASVVHRWVGGRGILGGVIGGVAECWALTAVMIVREILYPGRTGGSTLTISLVGQAIGFSTAYGALLGFVAGVIVWGISKALSPN
jgi:hypothetical protein